MKLKTKSSNSFNLENTTQDIDKAIQVIEKALEVIPMYVKERGYIDQTMIVEVEDSMHQLIEDTEMTLDEIGANENLISVIKGDFEDTVIKAIESFKIKAEAILYPENYSAITDEDFREAKKEKNIELMYSVAMSDKLTSREASDLMRKCADYGHLHANLQMSVWLMSGENTGKDINKSKEYSERYHKLKDKVESLTETFSINIGEILKNDRSKVFEYTKMWATTALEENKDFSIRRVIYEALRATVKEFNLRYQDSIFVIHIMTKMQNENIGVARNESIVKSLINIKDILMDAQLTDGVTETHSSKVVQQLRYI